MAPIGSPSTISMRLSPLDTAGRKAWAITGSREPVKNSSSRESRLGSSAFSRNTPAPPAPYSGLTITSPWRARNALMASGSRVTRVGGCTPGKVVTNSFSGAFLTSRGSFTTRVRGWIASSMWVEVM